MSYPQNIESANTFYNNKITELNHANLIQDIKAKYGKDLDEYLQEKRNTPESQDIRQDIVDIAQASNDYRKLITYLGTCLENECRNESRDNRVQLSRLKIELEKLLTPPDFEITGGYINGKSFNILKGKISDRKFDTGEITQEATSIPNWTKISYGGNQEFYIYYQGRDKISFYSSLNGGYLGTGDIEYKKSTITRGQYNRNGILYTEKIEKNAKVSFNLRKLRGHFDMKFYDYGEDKTDQ